MAELGWRDALFSLKTFAAAMLAVYIAFGFPCHSRAGRC